MTAKVHQFNMPVSISMMVHAPLPSPYPPRRQLFHFHELSNSSSNMNNDGRRGPPVRRVPTGSDSSHAASHNDRSRPSFVPHPGMEPVSARPSSASAPTPTEATLPLESYYTPDAYTSPTTTWAGSYGAGDGASELSTIQTYQRNSIADVEATRAFDDLMYVQELSQFPGRYNEQFPLATGGTAMNSLIYHTSGPGHTAIPTTLAHVISPVPSMPLPSTNPVASPILVSSTRDSTPAPAPTQVPLDAAGIRGTKRVRESPPPERPSVPWGHRAYKKLKRQAPIDRPPSQRGQTAPPDVRVERIDQPTQSLPASVAQSESSSPSVTPARQPSAPPKPKSKDDSRTQGACWRCRRYKKPCNNREGICDTCRTSGFRIWPASLGCRRGDIQQFVDAIMPEGMEDRVGALPRDLPGVRTWRVTLEPLVQPMPAEIEGRQPDKWDHLSEKVISTRIFGLEFVELFEILAQHQREAPKEHPLLNLVAATLSYSVDLYHRFVTVDENSQPEARLQTAYENVVSLRSALSSCTSTWLSLCLRGRLSDFPIAFLVAALTLCALCIFADTVAALKVYTGETIWSNTARDQMSELREELMTIAVDLLNVVGKGQKPLRFRCFAHAVGEPRIPEGVRLMAKSTASFDIMAGLQQWIVHHREILDSDEWELSPPFTPSVRPIQSMSRLVRMGYGEVHDST